MPNKFKMTPLHYAFSNEKKMLELIVNEDKSINLKTFATSIKNTPLHFATKYGKSDVVEYLIEKGVNINAKNNAKETPLHFAAKHGKTDVAKVLIDKNCLLDIKNNNGLTAQELAKTEGHKEIVKLILEKQLKDLAPQTPQPKRCKIEEDCTICCNPKEGLFAFLPCFHAIACEKCCLKISYDNASSNNACPICRKKVTGYQKIYVP